MNEKRQTGRTKKALAQCLIKVVRGGIGVFAVKNDPMVQHVNHLIHDWADAGVVDVDPYPNALRGINLRQLHPRKGGC